MKQCTACGLTKPLDEFYKNARMKDGKTAACKPCFKARVKAQYDADPDKQVRRVYGVRARRFEDDPAYKRAFRLWNHAYMRTAVLPCMSISDFVPICRKVEAKGAGYVLDHIVPLKHPSVSGLHVPWNLRVVKHKTNAKKGATFKTDWE